MCGFFSLVVEVAMFTKGSVLNIAKAEAVVKDVIGTGGMVPNHKHCLNCDDTNVSEPF